MEAYKPFENISSGQIKQKTFFGFAGLILFLVTFFLVFKWINKQPLDNGTPTPVRSALKFNEVFFAKFYSPYKLSKTFSKSEVIKKARVNGFEGLKNVTDTTDWKLKIIRKPGDTLLITLAEIKALPKTEVIFDFKCIEGWSQITHWGGVKFSDFIKAYNLNEQSELKYVSLKTPDNGYYVGLDMPSMLHPQTLLCYEINNAPLPVEQGFPLRLIIPVKYGIKHLKRIGFISFSNERPADYWYERGYDYYSGL